MLPRQSQTHPSETIIRRVATAPGGECARLANRRSFSNASYSPVIKTCGPSDSNSQVTTCGASLLRLKTPVPSDDKFRTIVSVPTRWLNTPGTAARSHLFEALQATSKRADRVTTPLFTLCRHPTCRFGKFCLQGRFRIGWAPCRRRTKLYHCCWSLQSERACNLSGTRL
jgi:hypothetical protein